jgi:hypothetical protein
MWIKDSEENRRGNGDQASLSGADRDRGVSAPLENEHGAIAWNRENWKPTIDVRYLAPVFEFRKSSKFRLIELSARNEAVFP